VDGFLPAKIPADVTMGRWPNGTGALSYLKYASPGNPNTGELYSGLSEPPVFSHPAGFYLAPFYLTINSNDAESKIFYTLDGSDPDPNNLDGTTFQYKNNYPGELEETIFKSYMYNGPIYIESRTHGAEILAGFATDYHGSHYSSSTRLYKGTVVRAVVCKDGALPSDAVTHTFFFDPELQNRYTLPVICITTQASNLFDYSTGIYTPGEVWEEQGNGTKNGGVPANYNQRGMAWERKAHLEIFDGAATNPVISQNIGIRTHGGWSRAHTMKSLRLYARDGYGNGNLNHKIFPNSDYQSYKRLVLRNSGNDWGSKHFLDAAVQTIASGLRCNFQAYRPAILFMNGEYWGINNIRERYDKYYLNRVYGVEEDSLDILQIVARSTAPMASEGDMNNYLELTSYLENNNMAMEQHYNKVITLMDIDNFIDFQISHIYAGNTDWPGNNNDFWRLRTNGYNPYSPPGHDGRWRWLVYDTDFGFGGTNTAEHNTLNHATSPTTIWQNPPFSTLILRRLLLNETFRYEFINRFADLLNTHFLSARAASVINQLKNNLEPEMPTHISRWRKPGSMSDWHSEVDKMITFVNNRPSNIRQHIQNKFGTQNLFNLNVDVSDQQHGYVRVNTIEITPQTPGVAEHPYPWSGKYFQGIPVELEAIPKPGYVFSHWEGLSEPESPLVTSSFSAGPLAVKAHFVKSNLVHHWDFNNLPGISFDYVTASYSTVNTGVITYPGNGNGYFDRIGQGTSLNANEETLPGFALRVRNPSAERELLIEAPTNGYQNIAFSYATMRTTNGSIIQEIQYRTALDVEWQQLSDLVYVEEAWKVHRYTFSSPEVNDNPHFALRILFRGEQTTAETGNNRFDNISIEGMNIYPTNTHDMPITDNPALKARFKAWHRDAVLNVENPWEGNFILTIHSSSGAIAGMYTLNGKGKHSFNFSPAKGIYLIQFKGEGKVETWKFVVID
jgi:hypothetical protein